MVKALSAVCLRVLMHRYLLVVRAAPVPLSCYGVWAVWLLWFGAPCETGELRKALSVPCTAVRRGGGSRAHTECQIVPASVSHVEP